jgi:hypothetical protein
MPFVFVWPSPGFVRSTRHVSNFAPTLYDEGMRSRNLVAVLLSCSCAAPLLGWGEARADGPCTPQAVSTWGATPASVAAAHPRDESPVARARDLLARAKLLDEAATADDKSAAELALRLPTLRASAKTARDRADRAAGDDREVLVSRAEDLEADLAVSEAEAAAKKRSAIENRRIARDLRANAVRIVREGPEGRTSDPLCDPPYRFTADGRKIYRVECLK